MLTIFTLSNPRSGTTFLAGIFKKNVKDCTCRHEPYADPFNPTLFGRPIYLNTIEDDDNLRPYLLKKKRRIENFKTSAYFESSHAFLKSANRLAMEYFPNMMFIHLIRNPLKMARSLLNREMIVHKYRFPFRNYRADDGNLYFRWSLTGKEPIYDAFKNEQLTRFQHYVIEWIEIENRAISLLDKHSLHDKCFTIQMGKDLNNKKIIKEMMNFLGLQTFNDDIIMDCRKNVNPKTVTNVTKQDEKEFLEVIERLPANYLEIFKKSECYHELGVFDK